MGKKEIRRCPEASPGLQRQLSPLYAQQFKRRLKRLIKIREQATLLHAKADRILRKMVSDLPIGVSTAIGTSIYTLVDQFATKEVVFRPAGVRRFDIHCQSVKTSKFWPSPAAKKGKK